MKVIISQAAPHPQGLRLGLRIEHEKAGWVRFSATVLVVEELSTEDRAALTFALDRARYRSHEDLSQETPLF